MGLTQRRLHDLLHYDPSTGLFVWKTSPRRGWAGKLAGSPKDGYVEIGVLGVSYRAHRLAWLYMTGDWPPSDREIDHRDRDRANNKWQNLRLATRPQNNVNSSTRRDNLCGHKGIYFERDRGRYRANIKVRGRSIRLGRFLQIEDAISARRAAEITYYGEFGGA